MANTKTEAQSAVQDATAATKKEYELRSANKFLTVSALNVQFMKGRYKTSDPAVAKALLGYEGVELVED